MPGTRCIATTKAGKPCPVPHHGDSQYCIGHDPAITTQRRNQWREVSKLVPPERHPNYKLMTPEQIVRYVSQKVAELEEKWGQSVQALPVISDFLRVGIQANRLIQSRKELKVASQDSHGPRTVRIVRDELEPPAANAG